MKKLYLILISLSTINNATAQTAQPCSSCLPEGITFSTQAQVDSFQINYPGCTVIEGDVVINSGYGIINLVGLSVLTSITGNLNIVENYSLSSLNGLEGLTSIGYWLNIVFNNSLESLTGLVGLSSIGGGLVIQENDSLINLAGLEGLISMGGDLRLVGNDSISSLTGLDNINAGSIASLLIIENYALSTCDINSICNYLTAPNGTVEIYNNASGCNSQEEVAEACGLGIGDPPGGDLQSAVSIYPNPSSNQFTLTFSLSEPAQVALEVLNQVGQVVETILDESLSKGDHQVAWNAGNLSPGIYFLRISSIVNRQSSIQKLVVVR